MPSDRDWLATLLAEVNDLPDADNGPGDPVSAGQVDFIPGAYGAVMQAAAARRISVASFTRRAAYAMAAHDLGIPLQDLITRDPRMARNTGFPVPDPHMKRFGLWEIERLVGEQP